MKYLLIILLVLSFISPSIKKDNSTTSSVVREGAYNYITCLDNSVDYLVDNVPVISKLSEIPYKHTYNKVMKDRSLTKHLITSNETLDEIIKNYNTNISDIEDFRKVVIKENPGVVSKTFEIKSGEYIVIPSN